MYRSCIPILRLAFGRKQRGAIDTLIMSTTERGGAYLVHSARHVYVVHFTLVAFRLSLVIPDRGSVVEVVADSYNDPDLSVTV